MLLLGNLPSLHVGLSPARSESTMSIPDPVAVGVTVAGTLGLAKQAQDFIAAAGRPGESLGTILGDLGRRRIEYIEAVGNKAHFILLGIGVSPGEVPLNVLHPLLESASLQEEDKLQSTWANLLATASDPRRRDPVEPSFIGMLKELSWREVRFLDCIYRDANGIIDVRMDGRALVDLFMGQTPADTTDDDPTTLLDVGDFQVMMDLLEKHRILDKFSERVVDPNNVSQAFRSIYHRSR